MQATYRRLLAFLFLLMLALPLHAQPGALFPPEGLSSNQACPSGQVLGWSGNSVTCTTPAVVGTWAGYCKMGWGGVDLVGTPTPPAYFDPTPRTSTDPNEVANAAANGWQMRNGCSCPSGWQALWTGTCDFGYCTSTTTGGSATGQVYFFVCTKI
jgi:hypothetical protein